MTASAPIPPAAAPRRGRELPPAVARLAAWARRRYLDPELPAVAVEFRAGTVGVVRVRREKGGRAVLLSAAALELPPGALVPSMVQPNVVDPERVRAALRGALERCGVMGGARVAVVLPDAAVRVSLVPAAELNGKSGAPGEELLRFRLRKALPFDVREARLAWVTSAHREDPVVVVAVLRSVLEGYESVCRSAGLEPGLVEPAALALARAAFGPGTTGERLLVNWEEGHATFVVARGDWPVLVRTLTGVAAAPGEIAREVASTLLYYRDRMGGGALSGAVVRPAATSATEAVSLLEGPMGTTPGVLDPLGALGGGATVGAPGLAAAAAALGAA